MIAARLQAVRERIADAARRSGRSSEDIRLICVTKSVGLGEIREAIAAGVTDFGENRVQEATPKIQAVAQGVTWHMIGHLQRNKARAAIGLFEWIHSVDDVALAQAVDRHAAGAGRTVPILLEVNTSGEGTKHGVAPEAAGALLEAIRPLRHVEVRGLMTMAPLVRDPEEARPYFRRLREVADRFRLRELSMGMSQDFEAAIEEGATMVRIGTAIFGV